MHGKRLARYALGLLVMAVTTCLAVAPPPQQSAPVSLPAAPIVRAAPPPVSPVVVASNSSNAQVWNLKNADIRAVIQTISILTGKNFIVDPRVHGNITLISQKPMAPDEMYQVFLSMLQLLQFAAIPSGGIIKIVPSMDANSLSRQVATNAKPGSGDEIVVRVLPIQHVSATELVPVLRPLMSQSGSISAYLPSNALILAGTASNIERLSEVVAQMDSENSSQITVVPLHYANAKKVVSVIHALQTGGASQGNVSNTTLAADEEDNSILVSANMTNQLLMRRLIHRLDRKGQGGDDTQVVALNYLTAKKLAPMLAKIASGISASSATSAIATKGAATDSGGGSSSTSIQAEDSDNAIVMHGSKVLLRSLRRVINRLDVRPQEVLVEAIIVKVDENLLDKLGIQWGSPDAPLASDLINAAASAAGAAAGTGTGVAGALAAIASPNDFAFKVNKHGIGLLPDGNLMALLHLLKSDGSTDVLSTPSVSVLNNTKASIDDGQNVGMANRSYQGASSTTTGNPVENIVTPYNTIQRQDVTLSLEVTPHVSPNNMIRMDLLQQDDTVASTSVTDPDNPTLDTSKIKTSVLVRSGDILVLGGLISNEQDKTTQKIPVLGDLPLIGKFFRYDSNKGAKTSLMVFIRPIIMSGKTAHIQTMGHYRYLRQQQIELETSKNIEDNLTAPMLPNIDKKIATQLPKPVSTFQLPAPKITTGSVH